MNERVATRLNAALAGRYRIERELGSGGSGIVFLARDVRHDRHVALKVLRPEIGQSVGAERFLREIRIASRLSHPNILSLIDSGEADGLLYYVTFYVDGESLRERLDREVQLPVEEAVRLVAEAAEALDHAHAAGVIHRDIKPENLLIGAGHTLVCDFGIARAIGEAGGDRLTQAGLALGTPVYMSPEQASADSVDARSDIYSLACVLYEMLVGTPPYHGVTPQAILARKASEPPPRVCIVRDTVPAHVEAALTRALARVPADRFATAHEFALALGGGASGMSSSAGRSAPRLPRRVAWATGAAALAAAAFGIFGVVDRGRRPTPLRATFSQLTAQAGVEDSPSLSPDALWVVYAGTSEGDRDVLLRSVGGQLAINLTEDSPADDYAPSFSPDGELIAFRSERDGGGLFVMGRTGEAVRRVASAGYNPRWSPDGTRLVYATEHVGLFPNNWETHSEIWTVDVASGETRLVHGGDGVLPNWSPDGRWIVLTARMNEPTRMDLWIIPVEGGEARTLTSDVPTDWAPTWSGDGAYLYFASDRGGSTNLWRLPMDLRDGRAGGEPEPVTTPATFASHPSLSADGRSLAYYNQPFRTINVEKAVLDVASGSIRDPLPLTTGSRSWSSPDATADGGWIAFYSIDLPEGDLYVVRGDGTGLRLLTGDEALDRVPRWSPDGSRLAYFSNRSGVLQLWLVAADGSGNRQLTDDEFSSFGAWSPDGNLIAVNGTPPGAPSGEGVYIFDPDVPWTEQEPRFLPPPDPGVAPQFTVNDWSPDGARLAGMVGVSDDGIFVYALESGSYERLTDFGHWPVWLPDSRRLLFVTGGAAYHVIDAETKEVQLLHSERWDVLGPPQLTADGREVVYTRRTTEGDIWLASLQ